MPISFTAFCLSWNWKHLPVQLWKNLSLIILFKCALQKVCRVLKYVHIENVWCGLKDLVDILEWKRAAKETLESNCLEKYTNTKENQLNNSLENALLNGVSYCNVQMCLKRLQLENWFWKSSTINKKNPYWGNS